MVTILGERFAPESGMYREYLSYCEQKSYHRSNHLRRCPRYSPSSYRFYFSELRLARRDNVDNYGLYALCADAFSLFALSSRPVEARVEWWSRATSLKAIRSRSQRVHLSFMGTLLLGTAVAQTSAASQTNASVSQSTSVSADKSGAQVNSKSSARDLEHLAEREGF